MVPKFLETFLTLNYNDANFSIIRHKTWHHPFTKVKADHTIESMLVIFKVLIHIPFTLGTIKRCGISSDMIINTPGPKDWLGHVSLLFCCEQSS